MKLPYKISMLLYFFNVRDEVLLFERRKEPSRGCWSQRRCYKESGLGRESGLQELAAEIKPT